MAPATASTAASSSFPVPDPDELFPEQIPLALSRLTVQPDAFQASLARYDEDEWADALDTTIEGSRVGGDRLEGTLMATGADNGTVPQCGRWWAVEGLGAPSAGVSPSSPRRS